jgi:hypothetical protein
MKMEISEAKINELYEANRAARAKGLTLCIDMDLCSSAEPNDSWLPNQLCRLRHDYSRDGLREFIEESLAALD